MAKRNLKALELAEVVTIFQEWERLYTATLIGINEDGFFGSLDENWRSEKLNAFDEAFVTIPWVQVFELLGRAPNGATLEFLSGQTRPNSH